MPIENAQKYSVEFYARLITQHHSELRRFIVRKLGTEDSAEDILQDTYIRLTHYQDLENVQNHRAFIFRIVANLVIDYQRSSANRLPHENDETILHEIPDPQSPPDRQCSAQQRLDILKSALSELPITCRQAFYLNRIEGLSHAEIAVRLHISESMVAKHIVRAMTHCRDRMNA
jgi:RNA polymerase sigma factor (sigma-70 family)